MSRRLVHGWNPDTIDPRDLLYRKVAAPRLEPLPDSVDLRPQDSPIMDQGPIGSCTGNSTGAADQFMQIKNGQPLTPVSRLMLYFNGRDLEVDTSEDNGAQIRDVVKGLAALGVCPEADWPYNVAKFADRPDEKAYAEALPRRITSYHRILTLNEMLQCLADGFPFIFGFTVYSSFESEEVARTGVVNMPAVDSEGNVTEEEVGGHAVMAVGYDRATRRFIVRNSWGESWGQKGYFTIPFEYLETMADDFWTLRK